MKRAGDTSYAGLIADDLKTGRETGYGNGGHPTLGNPVGSYAATRTRTTTRRAIPCVQPLADDLVVLAPQAHCHLTINLTISQE
jgi:hypothetical protein